MSEELKPCPFCGGEAASVTYPGDGRGQSYAVNCIACGVNNRGRVGWPTNEEAASAWNRRIGQQQEAV
jgi:Lar family restriction alleviation protein